MTNTNPTPSLTLQVKKLSTTAHLPTKGREEDAGFDLYAHLPGEYSQTLRPGERHLVPTGVAIEVPAGYVASIRPRSGLALKQGVTVLNSPGTIDRGYTGEVQVLLINHGTQPYTIVHGERIAQLVFEAIAPMHPVAVEVQELPDSVRGTSGFGSSGL